MGLFGKKRHGKLTGSPDNRQFIWEIPQFLNYPNNATLDSDYAKSFKKHDFHFHLSVGPRGDIGLYVHYRSPPIPKYSYYFQNAVGERTRQQTAHTIPQETERCGHWNVITNQDMKSFLQRAGNDTLQIVFMFDDDQLERQNLDDIRLTWKIPKFQKKYHAPLTSPGFSLNGSLYILRMDVKPASGDYVFFIFCRKGAIPFHQLGVTASDGTIIGQLERKDELGAQALVIPKEALDSVLLPGAEDTMIVTLVVFRNSNPLDFLNTAAARDMIGLPSGGGQSTQMVDVGNEQYHALSTD